MVQNPSRQYNQQIKMAETKLILGYWNIRGLGERVRQLLQYTGLPYEEVKYDEAKEDQWFKVDKVKLIEKNPAVNLPYLIDGDRVISESAAVCVYICHKAKRLDLLGVDEESLVTLATAYGVYVDFHKQYLQLVYGHYKEKTWEEALVNYGKNFEGQFKKLEGILGNKQFICGGLTWIDFAIADSVNIISELRPEVLAHLGKLVEYQKRVWALPALQAYFNSPRNSLKPVNGVDAKWR